LMTPTSIVARTAPTHSALMPLIQPTTSMHSRPHFGSVRAGAPRALVDR
jgi:hypothetical protein